MPLILWAPWGTRKGCDRRRFLQRPRNSVPASRIVHYGLVLPGPRIRLIQTLREPSPARSGPPHPPQSPHTQAKYPRKMALHRRIALISLYVSEPVSLDRPHHRQAYIRKETMLLHPSLLAFGLLAVPLPTCGASYLCAEHLYGRPLLSDAIAISKTLPYVKSDPDHQMDAVRIFAEPAFFTPKFQGLLNTWSSAMVQLPRVWRYS